MKRGAGRHWRRVALFAAVWLVATPGGAVAQEWLGIMPAADCRSLGGAPDSSITDEANPDPPRGCWRHYTSTQPQVGQPAGGTITVPAVPAPSGGANDLATGLQAGGAALGLLGQLLENFEDSEPAQPYDPYAAQADAFAAQKKAEEQVIRQKAHAHNEDGRKAAAEGKMTTAMLNFQLALNNADQIGDHDNAEIYRDNMNTMRAYIAYDSGMLAWEKGEHDLARKKFGEAIYLAQYTRKHELAKNMRAAISSLPAPDAKTKTGADARCMAINGELMCQ